MDNNSIYITAGNLTNAYYTVNSTSIRGEINNSGNRQPVPAEAIWGVFKQFVTLVEQETQEKV